jgi:hypothetical protein
LTYVDEILLQEGSSRFAPDTKLEACSKEQRGLETEDLQTMARKQDEALQKKTKKKKKMMMMKRLHWYEGQ